MDKFLVYWALIREIRVFIVVVMFSLLVVSICLILSQACMTVEWSRLPKFSPILGRDILVSSRVRYIATCLAWARSFVRSFPVSPSSGMLKNSATFRLIRSAVRGRSMAFPTISLMMLLATERVISVFIREA